jgi:hypothetical protein
VIRSSLPVLLLAGVLVAGCGTTEPTAVAPQVTAAADANLVLEPASSKPLVVFKGLVNGGRPLRADLSSFDALPTQTLTVVEPFVKKSMTFEGVGFADLLNAAKATGTSLTVHAADDYEVTFDAAMLQDEGALLATHVDGKPIEVRSGGPVRMIFPASSKAGKDTDLWVWSVDQVLVE